MPTGEPMRCSKCGSDNPTDKNRAVSEGLQMLEGGRRHIEAAELYRVKGELLLLQKAGTEGEAEGCFRQAVEIA